MRIWNEFVEFVLVWSENGRGKLHFFGLKSGQDLENWAAHPHDEFPGVPSPPDTQSTVSQQTPSYNGYLKMVPAFLQFVSLTTH